jgi:hypothetical protein
MRWKTGCGQANNFFGGLMSNITTEIRALKKQINALKKLIEFPDNEADYQKREKYKKQLKKLIGKLNKIRETLGESYPNTAAEVRAVEFEKKLPFITKLVFSDGGFHGGYITSTVLFTKKHLFFYRTNSFDSFEDPLFCEENIYFTDTPKKFLSKLKKINVGEWRNSYCDHTILDGEQWSLEIIFSDGHKKVSKDGSNAFPYNFEELKIIIDSLFEKPKKLFESSDYEAINAFSEITTR